MNSPNPNLRHAIGHLLVALKFAREARDDAATAAIRAAITRTSGSVPPALL